MCLCGMAMMSRLLQDIGLFCRIQCLLYSSFAKDTFIFREPTDRSRPISISRLVCLNSDI